MKTSDYWKKRVAILEEAEHANATKYANEISKIYDSATREIEAQLTKWYTRYANEEGITLTEAKRLLNTRELAEFRMDVHEYIKKGRSLDPKWVKQLEGASVRVHISRLEALKVQTQQLAERVKGEVADTFDEFAIKTYSDQYYKTIFEIQKGAGIGFDITKLDEKKVRKVINKAWAVDGKNFSQRIWGDRTKLVNELHQTLSKGFIQGKAPQKMVKELSERMGVSKNATARLIYTESSFFANQATLDSYKELGVERYEILATLDKRTTPICQKMDGKTFNVKEMEVGVNYPPFHVYCRTTTVPYFDDEFDIQEERASRDEEGKYYTVPASLKYPEWHEAFVNGGSKATLQLVKKEVIEDMMFPKTIANVERGKPMTREEANEGKVNPNFDKGGGYTINCQSCVVTYEARLRGYNVKTLPNPDTVGSKLYELSRRTNLAWIDKATGKHPEYIRDQTATTAKKFKKFLESVIEKEKRYTLEFSWKGRSRSGHIICVDRTNDGALRLYDPQIGKTYLEKEIDRYLNRFKYVTSLYGQKIPIVPKILRIDDKEFNLPMVNHIMEAFTNG